MIESVVVNLLSQHPALAICEGRVYHEGSVPQGEVRPRVVFRLAEERRVNHLGGHTGLVISTFACSFYAVRLLDIRAARGLATSPSLSNRRQETIEGVYVEKVLVGDFADGFVPPPDGQQRGERWLDFDLTIGYRERII